MYGTHLFSGPALVALRSSALFLLVPAAPFLAPAGRPSPGRSTSFRRGPAIPLGADCTASRTASRTCSTGVVSAQICVDLHPKYPTDTVSIGYSRDLRTGSTPAVGIVGAFRRLGSPVVA